MKITDSIGLVSYFDWCEKLYKTYGIKTVLDLGAGTNPQFKLCSKLDIRQLLIDLGYPEGSEGNTVRRKIDVMDFKSIELAISEFLKGPSKVDCVVSIQNIEHLTQEDGVTLLHNIERFAEKLVIFETPNGFVEQPGTHENPFQEHKSGWTVKDFKRLGYEVRGTTGFKFLKKGSDKGAYRINVRGMRLLDVFFSRIFFIHLFPRLCFNIIAFKEIGAK